ncbi:MAG: hypothetical protein EA397_10040 [Deltaproteobacteria bacterium]|nr:MAG: hypothetical protein EA397_10040 [Deltaproteobacteria bacterium]
MLVDVVEWLARGVRSSRALQEVLGVDLRTIQYYLQAAEWLGLIEPGPERLLTPVGLEVALSERPEQAYARAVWSQPMVAELLAARSDELPSVDEVMIALGRAEPELSTSTVRRRASAVRSLIQPAIGQGTRRAPDHLQLDLPLVHRAPAPPPVLVPGSAVDADPDVYRFLFCGLLDHGELSLGQLRALLDRAGGKDLPIGGYVDLALQRGDAKRHQERIVVTWAAVDRRDLAESTPGLILSHPGYRQWLRDLREAARGDRPAEIRISQHARRYRAWDHRLFGEPADARTLDRALAGVILDRSPESYPIAGDPGPELSPNHAPYLSIWEQPDVVVALPPSLGILHGGLSAVNQALQRARQGSQGVGLPDLSSRPLLVHGGLLRPGEPLPRSIPDGISLRARIISHVPYATALTALLLLHREHPDRIRVRRGKGEWTVLRRGRRLGPLLEVLDTFFLDRAQLPCRRRAGGLRSADFVSGLQTVGILLNLGGTLALDERLFFRLRHEPEQMELHATLRPFAQALRAHLDVLDPLVANGDP